MLQFIWASHNTCLTDHMLIVLLNSEFWKFENWKTFQLFSQTSGLFPGKIATTVFRLKIEFMEKTQGLASCHSSKNTAAGFKFEI